MAPRPSSVADGRLMTPEALDDLRSFSQLPDFNSNDRLSLPRRRTTPARRNACVIVGAELLPLMELPSEPSESLRGHTISEALRVFPEMRSDRLEFVPSITRNDLPLMVSHGRMGSRLGDSIHSSRMRSNYRSLQSHVQSSTSMDSLMLRSRSSSAIYTQRRGRAMMLSGGAPLNAKSQASLDSLQQHLLKSFRDEYSSQWPSRTDRCIG